MAAALLLLAGVIFSGGGLARGASIGEWVQYRRISRVKRAKAGDGGVGTDVEVRQRSQWRVAVPAARNLIDRRLASLVSAIGEKAMVRPPRRPVDGQTFSMEGREIAYAATP